MSLVAAKPKGKKDELRRTGKYLGKTGANHIGRTATGANRIGRAINSGNATAITRTTTSTVTGLGVESLAQS